MRLIPMSGHAMLNLVNGVIALALNVALNWFLIPEYGALGAALATGLTLALWSLWRVVEVWFLLKCFPFGWRALVLMAVSAAGGGALFFLGDAWSLAPRLGAAVGLGVCFLALALAVGRTPEDRAVLGRVQGRLKRLLGRR
jgi:O-antigen/teichoic acid export membrane protein